MKPRRIDRREREFILSEPVDEALLLELAAPPGITRSEVVNMIKEHLIRRGKTCALCGKYHNRKELSIDHRRPPKLGGRDNLDNLQLLCPNCIHLKGAGTMLEARKKQRQNKKVAVYGYHDLRKP